MTSHLLPPVGFWSYARQDDQLSAGKLSGLRSPLIQDLQQQYGRAPIRLFQDQTTIPHGAAWEREIRKAIGESIFFIPILTPNFIQSEWCSKEVELFLDREAELRAAYPNLPERSRIFPIVFIDIDGVDPDNPRVLAALQALQWFDFRRLRHRRYDEASVREAVADLAASVRDVLRFKVSAPVGAEGGAAGLSNSPSEAQPAAAESEAAGTALQKQPPPPKATKPRRPRAKAAAIGPAATDQPAERGEAEAASTAKPGGAAPAPRAIKVGDVLNHMFDVKRFIQGAATGLTSGRASRVSRLQAAARLPADSRQQPAPHSAPVHPPGVLCGRNRG